MMKSIQYQNSIEDIRDYYKYWIFETPGGKKWLKQSLVYFHLAIIIMALLLAGATQEFGVAIFVFLTFEFILLIRTGFRLGQSVASGSINKWTRMFTATDVENFTSPKVFEMSEKGITISSQEEAHSFSWSRIKRIERSHKNLILFVGMRSIFLIPRKAFGSQSEFDDLFKDLQKRTPDSLSMKAPISGDIIWG